MSVCVSLCVNARKKSERKCEKEGGKKGQHSTSKSPLYTNNGVKEFSCSLRDNLYNTNLTLISDQLVHISINASQIAIVQVFN